MKNIESLTVISVDCKVNSAGLKCFKMINRWKYLLEI